VASSSNARKTLLDGLTPHQRDAVSSRKRRVLVVAGAGSGKTDVMARRVAWWVAVEGVPKDSVVAFTFTERAAEEMKFRVRRYIQLVTPPGEDATLGGMYVGTIHGFCLGALREFAPDEYHNYDVLDESSRLALVQRGYHWVLGLEGLKAACGYGMFRTIDLFLRGYDLLNEYDELEVRLPSSAVPHRPEQEADWCKKAKLRTKVGTDGGARAFAASAARYYAYLKCRRFLDFSTSQSEFLRLLRADTGLLRRVRKQLTHVMVDEVQDINPVQESAIREIVGKRGSLTAVGDHRQAIFNWRGGRVDIMAHLYEELKRVKDAEIIELAENFRSTPRIVALANAWVDTIGPVRSMRTPAMKHGNARRRDKHATHMAAFAFDGRQDEVGWMAKQIRRLIRCNGKGAYHDTADGSRGLTYADVAVLVRSSTDARTYMVGLERNAIPAVVRAGPDLFSQPEVLLFLAAMARAAGIDSFYGSQYDQRSLPKRIDDVLGARPDPESVIRAACRTLKAAGLPMERDTAQRLLLATELLQEKMSNGSSASAGKLRRLSEKNLRALLSRPGRPRRVFPQSLYHLLLAEVGVSEWDAIPGRGRTAMFHLGQLSSLIKGMEAPGWTAPGDFKYQLIALCQWGAQSARTEEAPLLVPPDAVTISTIHSAKGLEFAAVFLADVKARRFPSNRAKTRPELPFSGKLLKRIDPALLADNDNYDGERRLMYVALTRAERYLFITRSGEQRSRFFEAVRGMVDAVGGATSDRARKPQVKLEYRTSELKRELRMATSFSDLRYYLECPHDFYLRKVLGFAPSIDQAFGYGRGVHNLMRAVHSAPKEWAKLAGDPAALKRKLQELVKSGLFYLRYTTGEPYERMRNRALDIVSDYVRFYATELARLQFEPEREFETLIEEEQVLVSGAIDVVRLDDPPRVPLIDFKSGEPESDASESLDEEEMRLQVSLYGLAAKHELEYEPERGVVRYLAEEDASKRELSVDLDDDALRQARETVVATARDIRKRRFEGGPRRRPRGLRAKCRCAECDFLGICGGRSAIAHRQPRA